jgi:hypothetical protein
MCKIFKAIYLVILFISIVLIKTGYGQIRKECIIKVTIEYENFTTSTIEDVKCGFFKSTFKGSLKSIEINNKRELKLLSSYNEKFSVIKLTPIDVRASIKFYFKHFTDEYCMDRFGTFVGTKTGECCTNEVLATFIRKKCLPPNML